MKGIKGKAGIALAGLTASVAISQPAFAAQTEVTNIQLSPSASGIELSLQVQGNARPPIFSVNRGNSSIIDISNAQLRLVSGNEFSQPNPASGIANVDIQQLDADTIRIVVQGEGAAPLADVTRRDATNGILTMSFSRPSGLAGNPGSVSGEQLPSAGPSPTARPPFTTRAAAPPVGDIVVGSINANPERIELGSSQIIPKLLLRDAPVREVLTLLGRAAGTNVAFAEDGSSGGPTISLDIENESVDDVFNYVVRLTGLQASKVGQTVFVGKELPGDAQNRIVRTLRLNQIKATAKTTYSKTIQSQAETGGSVGGDTGGGTTAQTGINRESSAEDKIEGTGAKEILESYGANGGGSGATLLQNLDVIADARTNSVTLIGTPNKVSIASQLLTQLDVRKRQAAVNVKFIDVNLNNGKFANADLQYRANGNVGVGFLNRGEAGDNGFGAIFGDAANIDNFIAGGFATAAVNLTRNFLGQIFLEVRNNNAKILTNPTLVVQEGSSAQVNLTEQVFSGFETSRDTNDEDGIRVTTLTTKPIIQNAGVILNVSVDRIDDNGFVAMSLSPEVSSLSGQTFSDGQSIASLLQQRRLETGELRVRDGQTLVLSGIIRDSDRSEVSKVPILGDIPLLGRLFRRESKSRVRSELVVLVTPQILDDSDQSTYGYQYSPSAGIAPLIRN